MSATPPASAPDGAGPAELTDEQAEATMASRPYAVLLVIVAVVGVLVSFATWCFLELIHEITQELYTHLPHALGYEHGNPTWWPLPVLFVAGVITALAITRLPGNGGHVPAFGFAMGKPVTLRELPGILIAALAGIAFGIVLGPEAPLMALGPVLAVTVVTLIRRDTPPQALQIVYASGAFAAVSFLFVSPLIAAILIIEVIGLGGMRMRLVVIPGLIASAIGSLLAIGFASWSGLNRSAIALGPVTSLPHFTRPDFGQFAWTIAMAAVVAIVAFFLVQGGLLTHRFTAPRPLVALPVIGLVVAGLAIAFSQATGKSVNQVLFSGESSLNGLVGSGASWAVWVVLLLVVFKGLAYSLSLGSFRGGPTFPALFLGAAGGILASHLPGFAYTPAVAVGMGAAVVAILKTPLSAIVLATLLTEHGGTGDEPLIIVGVVVAYLVTLSLSRRGPAQRARAKSEATAVAQAPEPTPAAST
jgi:chloride channel protein, CIC family